MKWIRVKLSDAMASAVECRLEAIELDAQESPAYAALLAAIKHGAPNALSFLPDDAELISEALTDCANAEDASAENEDDREMAKFARRASWAFTHLGSRVGKAVAR